MVEILSILVKIIVVEIQKSLMMRGPSFIFGNILLLYYPIFFSRFYSILLLTQMQYVTFRRLLENLNVNIRPGINNYHYIQSQPPIMLQIYYKYTGIEFIQISITIINNNYTIEALNTNFYI